MADHECSECFWYDENATMLGEQCRGCVRAEYNVNWKPKDDRRFAKWIELSGMMPPEWRGRHICSECMKFALRDFYHREKLSDYCPSCGAEMER